MDNGLVQFQALQLGRMAPLRRRGNAVNSKRHSFERSREFSAKLPRFTSGRAKVTMIWLDERVLPHDAGPQKSRRKRGKTTTPRAKLSASFANSRVARTRYTPKLPVRDSNLQHTS